MTQPSESTQPIKCRNCGHDNLPTAKTCLVCDSPLTFTTRFERKSSVPTGLLPPTDEELEEQRLIEERERKEAEERKRKTQEAEKIAKQKSAITQAHKTSHKCPDCGYNNRIGDFFCMECGANLSSTPAKESPADITQEMKALKLEDIEAEIQRARAANEPVESAIPIPQPVQDSSKPKSKIPELKSIDSDNIPDGCFQFTSEMILRLTDVETGQYTEVMPNPKKPLLIGRSHKSLPMQPDVDLTPFLNEQHGVSRRHALIRLRDLRLELQDLNSTNGTGINGFRFSEKEVHEVRSGDVITLGRVSLKIAFMRLSDKSLGNVTDKLS